MTLVYAQQVGTTISVVSDTGVTDGDVRVQKEHEAPKIVILNPDLCVGFAGGVDLAHRYLRGFHSEPRPTVPGVIGYFEECHSQSNGQVDFLLMFNKPVQKIVRISGGRPYMKVQAAYIGDKDGFEQFQYFREHRTIHGAFPKTMFLTTALESEAIKGNPTFVNVGAMHRVVNEAEVPSVFGDAIAANNVDGYFRYRPYSVLVSPNIPKVGLPAGYMERARSELNEDVNYALSCFVSDPGAANMGIAMHHVFGKLTHLYSADAGQPLTLTEIIRNSNIKEFTDAFAHGYGEWRGTVNLRRPPPSEYGLRFQSSVQTTPWQTNPGVRPGAPQQKPK